MTLHFSNDLQALATLFVQNNHEERDPLERRIVVVPHGAMKEELLFALVKGHEQEIAMGPEIMTLSQMMTRFFDAPSSLELSLHLCYLHGASWHLAQQLASAFLTYSLHGKPSLPLWQEELWEKLSLRWNLKWIESLEHFLQTEPYQWSVFGFSFLPKDILKALCKVGAHLYLFSPCALFWADYSSDREKSFLSSKGLSFQREAFEEMLEGQHPLLANWGWMGKQMQLQCEEISFLHQTQEHYVLPIKETTLAKIQYDLVMGVKPERDLFLKDETLVRVVARSPLREVEALKDFLLAKMETERLIPEQILILTPDIEKYAPFLTLVFERKEIPLPISIFGLDLKKRDPVIETISLLFDLAKEEFALDKMLLFLGAEPVLSIFDLDLDQIRFWTEKAAILRGKEGWQGWEEGLKSLVLSLGQPQAPVELQRGQLELFDRFYTLSSSLCEDLSLFVDGTKLSMQTWILYVRDLIETYVGVTKGDRIYQDLSWLSVVTEEWTEKLFLFGEIEGALRKVLEGYRCSFHGANKGAIRCRSLEEGVIYPNEAICLLGLSDEAFPRVELFSSLYTFPKDRSPRKEDLDRDLFLQALSSARSFLWMSYIAKKEGAKEGAEGSFMIDELFSLIGSQEEIRHPLAPYHPSYFSSQREGPISYSLAQYKRALQEESGIKEEIICLDKAPGFANIQGIIEIDIEDLCRFAAHPLRYYLKEKFGLYPTVAAVRPFAWEGSSLLVSFKVKKELVERGLTTSLEEVFLEAEKRRDLPSNMFTPLFKKQITSEVALLKEGYRKIGVDPASVTDREIAPFDVLLEEGMIVRLKGMLKRVCCQGIILHGEKELEKEVLMHPFTLLSSACNLGPVHYLGKNIETVEGGASVAELKNYLRYALWGMNHGSPLIAPLISPLLEGSMREFQQKMEQKEIDRTLDWLMFRDPHIQGEEIYKAWSGYLKEVFHGLL